MEMAFEKGLQAHVRAFLVAMLSVSIVLFLTVFQASTLEQAEHMDGITASIIICVYNRHVQVVECLESLLAMDFKDFEIVVVDDASTDDTADRLEDFRQFHPRIPMTIVRNECNLGVSGARNAGLKAAQGEFVFFTDSDCTVDH